jgi:FkbM family methyltransferase
MEDHLGRLALFYGKRAPYFWEPTTMRLMEHLLANASQAIIAGSHIALTALYARKAMSRTKGAVHTFEPIDHLCELSKKNISLNQSLGQIFIHKAALGDTDGTVTMVRDRIRSHVIASQHENNGDTEIVPITTIDSYCKLHEIDTLDLVLLDIEGYEYQALQGMKHILSTKPPQDIIYEISYPGNRGLEAAQKIETYLFTSSKTALIHMKRCLVQKKSEQHSRSHALLRRRITNTVHIVTSTCTQQDVRRKHFKKLL